MRTLLAFLLLALVALPGFAEDEPPLPPPPPAPGPEDLPDLPEPPTAPDTEPAPMPEAPAEPKPPAEPRDRAPIENAQHQPAPSLSVEYPRPGVIEGETPVSTAVIQEIEKVHDQPWVKDLLALRLDVEFEVEHCEHQKLFVAAWFAFEKRGVLIKSLKEAFQDRSGYLSARTAPVRISAGHARYKTSLWVPYGAFPAPSRGDRYPVEARVKLFRRTKDGSEVVAEKTTTFTVYGPTDKTPDPDAGE